MLNKVTIKQITIAGVILTLLYAILSQGVFHPDEHMQILEFASMKLFGTTTPQDMPWEYALQMRPALQPFLAYALGSVLLWFELYSPFLLTTILHILSGAVSLGCLWFFYKTVEDRLDSQTNKKIFLTISLLTWCMAYMHVRFSSEMLSGNMLLLLIATVIRFKAANYSRPLKFGLIFGLLFGIIFITRFQVGFALFGVALWLLVYAKNWKIFLSMLGGFSLVFTLSIFLDYWLYDQWTITSINYLTQNILNDHISKFGVNPWYSYLQGITVDGVIIFGLPIIIATIWFVVKNPRSVITWAIVPFLLAHHIVGHKETRFMFVFIFFAPYFITLLYGSFSQKWQRSRAIKIFAVVAISINTIIIAFNLLIDNNDIRFYKTVSAHCKVYQRVAIVNLESDRTHYNYTENIIHPNTVLVYLYKPSNVEHYMCSNVEELIKKSLELKHSGAEVLILGSNQSANYLQNIAPNQYETFEWSPYPEWVVDNFNFNDWVGMSINKYKMLRVVD